MNGYVGRLAPSPTGLLHLGHARTFSIAYQRAQTAAGKLWLRNEDLDPQRSKPEYALTMREDLRWLGINWTGEMRQSERIPFYADAMQRLFALGLVYACTCSRRDLQRATEAPHEDADDEPVYRGTCRSSSSQATVRLTGINYRFRVPDNEAISFIDTNAGPQSFRAGCDSFADFGDFLVWRKDGLPSYQLACIVDDAAMEITEVVRGRDLLKSTARQILLQRALGLSTPEYFHCELMRDESGVRLAKRHDALSLRALRDSGATAAEVRAMLQRYDGLGPGFGRDGSSGLGTRTQRPT